MTSYCRYTLAGCVLLSFTSVKAQDSALINFTAGLDELTAINFPVDPLVTGPLATFAAGVPDALRLDAQIWIQDYLGAGTYTAGFDNVTGDKILVHSPILERIEAQTWRAEDASDFAAHTAGPVEIAGSAVTERTKWLLPDDSPNGEFSVTIDSNHQIVSLRYLFDFSINPGLPFADPDETGNPNLQVLQLDVLSIDGDGGNFGNTQVFAAGSQGFLDTPYGLNTQLDTTTDLGGSVGAFAPGTAGSTVGNSTIGQLLNEINDNTDELNGFTPNLSSDGRRDGDASFGTITNPEQGDGYLADIFAATIGDLYVFTNTSDLEVDITITQVPEPTSAGLVLLSAVGVIGRIKRRSQAKKNVGNAKTLLTGDADGANRLGSCRRASSAAIFRSAN